MTWTAESRTAEDPEAMEELRKSLQVLYNSANARPYLGNGSLPSGDDLLALLAEAEDECLGALVDDEDEA